MEGHDEKAEELEREVEELQEHSDQVGEHVEETKSTWESRQADESVPGAVDDETLETAAGAAGDDDAGDEDDEG